MVAPRNSIARVRLHSNLKELIDVDRSMSQENQYHALEYPQQRAALLDKEYSVDQDLMDVEDIPPVRMSQTGVGASMDSDFPEAKMKKQVEPLNDVAADVPSEGPMEAPAGFDYTASRPSRLPK